MIVIVMGVAGAGKTTVGRLVAGALGVEFLDADALHPPANVDKMSAGIALTDSDRAPWLSAVRAQIVEAARREVGVVVACSALKANYRAYLDADVPVVWAYLKADPDVVQRRLQRRTGHFVKADLLRSQFDALEEPDNALVLDASQPAQEIADAMVAHLRRREHLAP